MPGHWVGVTGREGPAPYSDEEEDSLADFNFDDEQLPSDEDVTGDSNTIAPQSPSNSPSRILKRADSDPSPAAFSTQEPGARPQEQGARSL